MVSSFFLDLLDLLDILDLLDSDGENSFGR